MARYGRLSSVSTTLLLSIFLYIQFMIQLILCVVFDDRTWHSSIQVSSMWSTYLGTNVLQGHWCLVVWSPGRVEVELGIPNDTFGGSESSEVSHVKLCQGIHS